MTHASNALEAMLVNVVCRNISEPVPPGQQAVTGLTPEMHPPTDGDDVGAKEGLNEGVFVGITLLVGLDDGTNVGAADGFKEGFRVGHKVGN